MQDGCLEWFGRNLFKDKRSKCLLKSRVRNSQEVQRQKHKIELQDRSLPASLCVVTLVNRH